MDCRQLLELMWQRPDSLPFREPVDTIEFPDYLEIIATPMDLRTVKEDLLGGNYEDPLDFAKDVRLIFQNSKNYNTNKRSRVSFRFTHSIYYRYAFFIFILLFFCFCRKWRSSIHFNMAGYNYSELFR